MTTPRSPAAAMSLSDSRRSPEPRPRDGGAPRPAVVSLERVSRRYTSGRVSVAALEDVSLQVFGGETVAIVGPSGCGKSTLLNVVSAVDRADSGSVVVCGCDLSRAVERDLTLLRRRCVGVVFQAFHLMPNLTATENVTLPLALAGRSDPERVAALLARVGLAARAEHYPSELSGGEQQRVALARALAHGPRLVVADEPTGNLDSASGREVLELLAELREEQGLALVIATHDAGVAARADRVVRLSDGRVVGVE